MNKLKKQNGQAMVVMAFALIVLLGVLALSIDGGRAFTERRKAQNTVDAATMAMIRELGSGASSVTAKRIGYETALANGYILSEDDIGISDTKTIYGITTSYTVSATIRSTIEGLFSQFVYDKFFEISVGSTMEVILRHTPFNNFGIVSLNNTCAPNDPGAGISGGGNSGGIRVYGASIIIGNTNPNNCAYDPPNSQGATGIHAYDLYGNPLPLHSVGSYTCSSNDTACIENMNQVLSGYNNGDELTDPLEGLPTPTCEIDDIEVEGIKQVIDGVTHYYPGNWNAQDLNDGIYERGIYCISGQHDMKVTNGDVYGDGVLFYFIDTGMEFAGQGSIYIKAPYDDTCLGQYQGTWDMDTNDSCNYKGLVIYIKYGNESDIIISGNSSSKLTGTMYGRNSTFYAGGGGGSSPDESLVWGQIIMKNVVNNGNGSLDVFYHEEFVYTVPPYINALR